MSSMTGFADRVGGSDGFAWTWEARSVNGRGLDLRLRLPDGMEALDPPVRAAAGRLLARGSVTVTLRLARGGRGGLPRLNAEALEGAVVAALAASETAARLGLDLAPMTAADLIGVRGVLDSEGGGAGGDRGAAGRTRRRDRAAARGAGRGARGRGRGARRRARGAARPDRGAGGGGARSPPRPGPAAPARCSGAGSRRCWRPRRWTRRGWRRSSRCSR